MVTIQGFLRELKHQVNTPVSYHFQTDRDRTNMEDWIGRTLTVSVTGNKACTHCGRRVKKLYQGGYCFPCVTTLAECDLCIVKPHECHHHLGTCRDGEFAETHCMIPHYVYLAFSSGVKVGLTRKGRELIRWVDQGASQAVLLAEVPTRKMAGELEMEVAKDLPDKTDWRKMLQYTGGDSGADLRLVRNEVIGRLPDMYKPYVLSGDPEIYQFSYPKHPEGTFKLTSISLDKQPLFTDVLIGVKGQYLMFENGVLNVKKHAGFECQVSVS